MKNWVTVAILGIIFSQSFGDVCLAGSVIEGGVFTEEKSQSPFESLGGLSGESLPTELYYASDRYANAPLDKKLFVVGDDGNCYYANFKIVNNKKTLIVYHQSRTYIENCIYQKKLMTDPSGFALFERDGGICKPVHAESLESLKKNGEAELKVVNNTVSIGFCTKQTSSFGLAFRTNQKSYKEISEPKIVEIATPVEKPKAIIAKPLAKPIVAPPEEKLPEKIVEKAPEKTLPEPVVQKEKPILKPEETKTAELPKKEVQKPIAKPKTKPKMIVAKKITEKKKVEPIAVSPVESPKPTEDAPPKWRSLLNQAKEKLTSITKENVPPTTPTAEVVKSKPIISAKKENPKKEKKKEQKAQIKTPRKIAVVSKEKPPQFTIQVGSFATEKEAADLILAMKKTDGSLEIFTEVAQVSGKTWHRVFVGRYTSRSDVKADIDRIRALSSSAAFIQSLKSETNSD